MQSNARMSIARPLELNRYNKPYASASEFIAVCLGVAALAGVAVIAYTKILPYLNSESALPGLTEKSR